MKKITIGLLGAVACLAMSCSHNAGDTYVTWQTLGNEDSTFTQRFIVTGNTDIDKIAFNAIAKPWRAVEPTDTVYAIMPGYYAIESSRFGTGADTLIIDILSEGAMTSAQYAPDGLHAVLADGTTRPILYTRMPLTQPNQWHTPDGNDRMPYGDYFYDINEGLQGGMASVYDVVPSYKEVYLTDGFTNLPATITTSVAPLDSYREFYTITVKDGNIDIFATDSATLNLARESFEALVLGNGYDKIPNVVIKDYPDYTYRGLMIDVSRNFQPIESMYNVIDLMAQYRLNRLHFHLIDDEGWRLEIPDFPELTEFGARRGYSPDESEFLWPMYAGDGNPNSTANTGNGYYTRQQFIDFLKYADAKGISVIPEFEMPGHSRAVVKAMEKRYRETGDDTYRMIHDGDTSSYSSAQAYADNVMNPALPGPYRFIDKVLDAIIDMYADAGVPLLSIHIGGDEVAAGAWDGSEAVAKLMAENGLDSQTAVHGYFVEKVADMFREKGIKMSGWQEIAVDHNDAYNSEMAPLAYSVNCWTRSNPDPEKNITVKALKAGFPVVISNVNHFYLDMAYNRHPEEPGLFWGGVVDEFQSLHGYPAEMCPVDLNSVPGKVEGLSAHVWAETLRSPQMLQMYLFPKMLGFVERSWNGTETYNDANFNAVVDREMTRWNAQGTNFHMRQPGIKVVDGKIMMNSPYPDATIRYTIDGTEPTADSPVYTEPIDSKNVSEARARLFHKGKTSLTSYLYL